MNKLSFLFFSFFLFIGLPPSLSLSLSLSLCVSSCFPLPLFVFLSLHWSFLLSLSFPLSIGLSFSHCLFLFPFVSLIHSLLTKKNMLIDSYEYFIVSLLMAKLGLHIWTNKLRREEYSPVYLLNSFLLVINRLHRTYHYHIIRVIRG